MDTAKIVLNESRCVYYSGQLLSGYLECELTESLDLTAINITYLGVANVKWTEYESKKNDGISKKSETIYAASEEYFNHTQRIYGEESPAITQLPAGKHRIHFAYKIPFDIPSSFNGKYGRVYYFILVEIIYPDPQKEKHKIMKKFKVVSTPTFEYLDRNKDELLKPAKIEFEEFYTCFCKPRPLNINIRCPVSHYCPGQIMRITVTTKNSTLEKLSRIIFQLVRKERYHSQDPPSTKTPPAIVLKTVQTGPVLGYTNHNATFELLVPNMIAHHLSNCGIIDVGYFLKVTVKLCGCSRDLEGETRIFIGLKPVTGTENYKHPLEHHLPNTPIPIPVEEYQNSYAICPNGNQNITPSLDSSQLPYLLDKKSSLTMPPYPIEDITDFTCTRPFNIDAIAASPVIQSCSNTTSFNNNITTASTTTGIYTTPTITDVQVDPSITSITPPYPLASPSNFNTSYKNNVSSPYPPPPLLSSTEVHCNPPYPVESLPYSNTSLSVLTSSSTTNKEPDQVHNDLEFKDPLICASNNAPIAITEAQCSKDFFTDTKSSYPYNSTLYTVGVAVHTDPKLTDLKNISTYAADTPPYPTDDTSTYPIGVAPCPKATSPGFNIKDNNLPYPVDSVQYPDSGFAYDMGTLTISENAAPYPAENNSYTTKVVPCPKPASPGFKTTTRNSIDASIGTESNAKVVDSIVTVQFSENNVGDSNNLTEHTEIDISVLKTDSAKNNSNSHKSKDTSMVSENISPIDTSLKDTQDLQNSPPYPTDIPPLGDIMSLPNVSSHNSDKNTADTAPYPVVPISHPEIAPACLDSKIIDLNSDNRKNVLPVIPSLRTGNVGFVIPYKNESAVNVPPPLADLPKNLAPYPSAPVEE